MVMYWRTVMSNLLITRFAYTPMGTFSRLTMDGFRCYFVEPPWRNNKTNISCIPEGWYKMKLRASNKVQQVTKGRHTKGWEICNVADRTFVMIHPGNTEDDSDACLCPGEELGFIYNKWAVTNSQNTFDKLMDKLKTRDEWTVQIERGML